VRLYLGTDIFGQCQLLMVPHVVPFTFIVLGGPFPSLSPPFSPGATLQSGLWLSVAESFWGVVFCSHSEVVGHAQAHN
jgi:hypothetical protein